MDMNTMESDGGNEAPTARPEGGEALAQHLLAEGYPVGWKAPKLAMYEGVTDLEDHLHCKGRGYTPRGTPHVFGHGYVPGRKPIL